jgi:PAS domain S-box-containing protein
MNGRDPGANYEPLQGLNRRLIRVAWLPIPLLGTAIIAGRVAGLSESYTSETLTLALSLSFYTLASLGALFLIGRSFLALRTPGLLFLECGVLLWSLAGTVGDAVSHGDANVNVTIFNMGILLAGMCHLAGAILLLRPKRALRAASSWLGVGCALVLGALWLIAEATLANRLPVFFIPGQGGTPVRYCALISALLTFALSAGLLLSRRRAERTPFVSLYAFALLLLATGLFGVMIQLSLGSVVNWLSRAAQWLGGVYLLVAAIVALRESDLSLLPQEIDSRPPHYRYGVAIAIIIAATAVRFVLSPTLGMRAPFLTFYPAVILAALYGGWRAGLLATALSALIVDFFLMESAAPSAAGSPTNIITLLFFVMACAMITLVAEAMHRARGRLVRYQDHLEDLVKDRTAELEQEVIERKRAEEEVEESRERWATTLGSIGDAVIATDTLGRITFMNGVAEALTGWTLNEASQKPVTEIFNIVDEHTRREAENPVDKALREGIIVGLANHTILLRKDGTEVPVDDSSAPIRDKNGTTIGVVLVFRDITERKRAEAIAYRHNVTLEGINRILNATLTSRTKEEVGIVCLEVAEKLTQSKFGFIGDVNENGLEDIAISNPGGEACRIGDAGGHGRPPGNFMSHGIYGRVLSDGKALFTNDPARHPDSVGLPDGHPSLAAFLGAPLISEGRTVGMIAVGNREGGYTRTEQNTLEALTPAIVEAFQRIRAEEALHNAYNDLEFRVQERTAELSKAYETLQSEAEQRRQAEDKLRQAQKMEAIGALAGGIAHDFNNILAGIIGFTEMALEDVPPEDPVRRRLELALKGGRRGRDLVRQILTFSRQTEQEAKEIAVSGVIEDALNLLRSALPSTIEIRKKITSVQDVVLADPVQLHRVLMNLCTNAAHAMRDKGGILEIDLADTDISEEEALSYPGMKAGRHILLSVKDTGCGMAPHVIEKIFDPFFTTKGPGEGTGLGLSVVHGIVKSHGGLITVDSEPDKGTAFHVYLPKAGTPASADTVSSRTIQGGKERILFVDDEEMLVELNSQRLERLGYEIVSSTGSREALDIFKADPGRFDLVITDYTMPNMTGLELAQALVEIRPDIPIILCSGLNESITAEQMARHGIRAFMVKAADRQEQATAIRRVLDGKTET